MERSIPGQFAATNRWLSGVKANAQATVRLFCFPYSGASASLYFSWRDRLPGIEVCPVELPGHGSRLSEPLYDSLESLVPVAAQALLPAFDKPFAFFGHSMGALLSFELARYLRRIHHRQPFHLFVSAHRAPHLPDHHDPIYSLPELQFIEKLREMNGTPPEVLDNAEFRELLMPILRADFAISETYLYRPDQPLDCAITALGGLQDKHTSRESLDAWREQTTGRFIVRMFPGGHFFLNTAQALIWRAVAQDIAV